MNIGINYKCEYLDMDSCSCSYLDEMNKMPSLTSECHCLHCIIALYKARGCNV